MLFLSGFLLFYTAIIVPVQICLWSYDDPCNAFATLNFDVIVDTFFLVEAFTQFFLGYYEEDMTYQDDLIVLLKRNLSSLTGFWFDCVTSIPWSYIDLHFYLECVADQSAVATTNSNARVIRVVKILRILRVARILKLVKFVTVLEDYAVLYFGSAIFKIGRLLFIAMLCVHFFACIYYRVKRDTTPNPDDVESFYQSKYVEQDDLPRAYLVCFYYVLTTFTTVGYGDISASSDGERVSPSLRSARGYFRCWKNATEEPLVRTFCVRRIQRKGHVGCATMWAHQQRL